MQTMVFTGRLAADPQISDDFSKAIFRLIEKRGVDADNMDRLIGVNCVSWSTGLNEKVIARGLAQGCEAVVTGAFVDTAYETREGQARTTKELVVNRLTVLDWAQAGDDVTNDEPVDQDGTASSGAFSGAAPGASSAAAPQAARRKARTA